MKATFSKSDVEKIGKLLGAEKITHEKDHNENYHLNICIQADLVENHSPWIKEYCFNIEHQKQHCDDVEVYIEAAPGLAFGNVTGFIGHELFFVWPARPE